MLGQLLGKVNRTMLAARAAERNHQVFEPARLIIARTRIDQRNHVSQKLAHALLLFQVFDHGRVFPVQRLEAFFAAGIRKAAGIKNEAATIPSLVHRKAAMK